MQYRIVTIDKDNLSQHPQAICFINPKQKSFPLKIEWIKQHLKNGLVIKLLYPEGERRAQGFIEYISGENAYRAVSAQGYLFIHCIFVYSAKYKNKGIGTILINDCLKEAASQSLDGVAVMCSGDAFMAKPELFTKNGFIVADKTGPDFSLLVKQIRKAPLPQFNDWKTALKSYQGLHIIYSRQCPWVARFVAELDSFVKEKGLKLTVTELKTPAEAQAAPSPYATFILINEGRILADHYISMTRFNNILKKEKLI